MDLLNAPELAFIYLWQCDTALSVKLTALIQMCELHKREFSFQVLNQAFMVSRGFRAKSSLSADERRVRDDWQEFKDNFSSALTKFGYTDEAYQQC